MWTAMGRGEVGDKAYVVKLSTMGEGGGGQKDKKMVHIVCVQLIA